MFSTPPAYTSYLPSLPRIPIPSMPSGERIRDCLQAVIDECITTVSKYNAQIRETVGTKNLVLSGTAGTATLISQSKAVFTGLIGMGLLPGYATLVLSLCALAAFIIGCYVLINCVMQRNAQPNTEVIGYPNEQINHTGQTQSSNIEPLEQHLKTLENQINRIRQEFGELKILSRVESQGNARHVEEGIDNATQDRNLDNQYAEMNVRVTYVQKEVDLLWKEVGLIWEKIDAQQKNNDTSEYQIRALGNLTRRIMGDLKNSNSSIHSRLDVIFNSIEALETKSDSQGTQLKNLERAFKQDQRDYLEAQQQLTLQESDLAHLKSSLLKKTQESRLQFSEIFQSLRKIGGSQEQADDNIQYLLDNSKNQDQQIARKLRELENQYTTFLERMEEILMSRIKEVIREVVVDMAREHVSDVV